MRESKENNRQERRTHQISNKINQKRRKKNSPSLINISSSPTISSFDSTYFPLLLAAAVRHGRNSPPLLLRLLLRRLRRPIILATYSESLPASLLSLLPLLLSSSSPSVTSLTAEVAGLASLKSIEQNEIIASDDQILKGLIQSLTSGSQKSVKAALNAVMDLSVSSFARDRLRDAGFINKLLYIISQMFDISQDSDRGIFGRKKLLNLFLEATTTLINTSKIDFTEQIISSELIQKILPLFSKINKINALNLNPKLAETIFRLSINLPNPTFLDLNELKCTIFGSKNSNFNEFLLNYWEKSPFLLKKGFENSNEDNSIFSSLINKWRNTNTMLDVILKDLISCPNISPDELDINNFLIETRGFLTSKLIYNQDIKIVKTEGPNRKNEKHFPFVEKYKDAYKEGYSIALKGMQFRNDQIALVSTTLSQIFGLPSIGVNLYLSPGGAQGLARHYDDHCVLIWQIIGSKFWRVFKNPIPVLPRLFEPFNDEFKIEEKNEDMMEILVQEGDVLYIPRGYFHEACTDLDASCSLHLTLAIEVDRPFEWEGFAHVALHCWYEKLKQNFENILLNSKFECNITFYLLLHISIKLIGDYDPIFRKACLVASEYEISSQKSIFDQIISKINEKSNFLDAFNWIKLVCEKRDEDSLQCLRWLKHLDQSANEIDFCSLLETLEKHVMPCRGQMDETMEEFDDFKGCFCKCVIYEDVCVSFGKLLEKYRKGRGQYMKGMLGLHRRY